MKICFINPPSPFLINDKVIPPLGILYLAAVTREKGIGTQIYDCSNRPYNKWMNDLKYIKADYYGITATTPQYFLACKIAKILKDNHPDSKIIIGGPHVSCGNEFNTDLFDITVLGEAEKVILEILETRMTGGYYGYQTIKGLNSLPVPARNMIDIHNYRYSIDGVPATSMITSRGCPYSCSFCCSANTSSGVRFHSAEYVINEISEIEKLGFRGIQFYDDIFILNKDRLWAITEHLLIRGIKYRCFVRANIVTPEIVARLKDTGCVEIGFGAESGSQKILDLANKKTTVQQNLNLASMCHEVGLKIKAFIIVGLPGETKETVLETEQLLAQAKYSDVDISILSVFKGSDIHKRPGYYKIKYDADNGFFKGTPGKYEVHVENKFLTKQDIMAARDDLEKKFKPKEMLR